MKQVSDSEGIGKLWALLKQVQLDLDAEEIADLLWLAVQMSEVEKTSATKKPAEETQTKTSKTKIEETTDESPAIPSQPAASVNLPSPSDDKSQSQTASENILFKTPAAPGLRNQLALARALRPLMRKVSSRTQKILDAEETVTQFAENRILIPKFKPTPERWLDLALVVEKSSSIVIWQEIIAEFQKLIELSGAFRSVSTWSLQTDEKGEIKLFAQQNKSINQQGSRSPKELLDSAGRRLILLVSDCTSQIWYQKKFYDDILKLWSNSGPSAIVQPFPERLWTRTAMGFGYQVLLSALVPGVPNKKLTLEGLPVWEEVDVNKGITLPVITLEPNSLKQWSRVVAGFGSTQTAGILFEDTFISEPSKNISQKDTKTLSAKDLVNRFRATASLTARRLAGLMATVPVSLPVVHLIQQTLLKESMQVHVAEVFMSGLLKPVSTATKGEITNYDFVEIEGVRVRDLLIDSVPTPDVDKVLHEVSQYIAKKAGISIENFAALLSPDTEWDDKTKQDINIKSFAKVTTDVLHRLGGEYKAFAEYLEQKSSRQRQPTEEHPDSVTIDPTSETMFNLEKAKILANICRATYESRPTFSEYAQSLSDSKLIKPTDESVPVRALSGFIDKELIIAFRGTVVANLNQETDIVLAMLACMFCNFTPILGISPEKFNSLIHEQEIKDIYGGEIHLGFALLMDKIWSQIQSVIEQSKPSKIGLTGHSLGGALATLAAYRLRNQNVPISVYTFGAPRVGDRAFASRYEVSKIPHFRIENKNDIVPHLPPDYQTKSKIEFTTQSINTISNLLHNLGLPIPNELRNLQIPNLDYPPVGSLKFIDWNETIVKDSNSLRIERLFRLPKNIWDIEKSQILFDHKIESYSQELNRCRIEQSRIEQSRIEQTEKMPMRSPVFEKIVYNIVVIGKTGAGKSALINYLYGETIARTGVGQPVTKEGFHKYNLTWKSIPINIYDSWGLEVGQDQNWLKMLDNELKEHGTDRPVSEWFHTIFYCINAASTRTEPFEFSIIQDLITNKYRVIVVLTRAELMPEESISTLKDYIREGVSSEIPLIEVCNVAQKTRIGETKTFGKEELQNETLRGFWNGITIRLPDRCEYVLHQEVDKWRKQQEQYLNSTKKDFWSISKQSEIKNTIEKNYMIFFTKLKDTRYEIIVGEVQKIVNYYKQLVEILDYPPPEDLPVFTLENEKLIRDTFMEQIVGFLQQAEQSYFRLIGNLIQRILPDKRATVKLEITRFCNDLKKEITRQKPEISKIIERIRKDRLETENL